MWLMLLYIGCRLRVQIATVLRDTSKVSRPFYKLLVADVHNHGRSACWFLTSQVHLSIRPRTSFLSEHLWSAYLLMCTCGVFAAVGSGSSTVTRRLKICQLALTCQVLALTLLLIGLSFIVPAGLTAYAVRRYRHLSNVHCHTSTPILVELPQLNHARMPVVCLFSMVGGGRHRHAPLDTRTDGPSGDCELVGSRSYPAQPARTT